MSEIPTLEPEIRTGTVDDHLEVGDYFRAVESPKRIPLSLDPRVYFRDGSPYAGEVSAMYMIEEIVGYFGGKKNTVRARLVSRSRAPEPFNDLELESWGTLTPKTAELKS